jgi:methyl-accepting chemotaxis protein
MTWWKNSSLVSRLAVSFSVPVLLLAGMGLLAERAASRINANVAVISAVRLPIIINLLEADRDLHQALVAERTLILGQETGDAARTLRAAIAENHEQAETRIGKASALAVTPEERALVEAFERDRDVWRTGVAKVLQHVDAGAFDDAKTVSTGELGTRFDTMREHVNKLEEVSERLAAEAHDDASAVYVRTRRILIAVTLAGVCGAALLAWAVSRWVGRRVGAAAATIRESAAAVADASAELSTSAQTLSSGATQQAASLEETSASMEELSAMTRQTADHTGTAASTMAETERLVAEANGALTAMSASMSAIVESSAQVSRIIKTIDEIAFQTNILALNAAVEAARAGEAGLGFAVVADEVRALAQRAARAAHDTSALIEESVRRATDGHTRTAAVTRAITSITDSTTRVKELVDGVSTASKQQSDGLRQIATALAEMEKVTQSNAASAEESAAASEELRANAACARRAVEDLTLLVDGRTTAPAAGRRVVTVDGEPAAWRDAA